ncbi:DUF2752 domain-containing protein [Winogradskyella sp.]|uniref:DUF2752 domain-containing protein n=1 Tax=Winogradskyella sp. TaxID=1883156 RepID=UPI00260F5D0F|nr:DUF2752 domain-containing protein [uncultured Winogradskyella sp.]
MFLLIKSIEDYMLPCVIKEHFGFDCIGCGLQRSAVFFINGQFLDAFLMYPALYPMLLFFVFLIFDMFKKIEHSEKIKLGLASLILIAAVTNYILKLFVN